MRRILLDAAETISKPCPRLEYLDIIIGRVFWSTYFLSDLTHVRQRSTTMPTVLDFWANHSCYRNRLSGRGDGETSGTAQEPGRGGRVGCWFAVPIEPSGLSLEFGKGGSGTFGGGVGAGSDRGRNGGDADLVGDGTDLWLSAESALELVAALNALLRCLPRRRAQPATGLDASDWSAMATPEPGAPRSSSLSARLNAFSRALPDAWSSIAFLRRR